MKQANIAIQIQLAGESKARSLAISLNSIPVKLKKKRGQPTWSAEKAMTGPVDFCLKATGTGTLILRLNCGKQVILKKRLQFTNNPIQLELKDIPLLD